MNENSLHNLVSMAACARNNKARNNAPARPSDVADAVCLVAHGSVIKVG